MSSTSPDPPSTGPPAAGRGAPDVDSRRGATGGRIDAVEPLVAGSTPWSRRVRIHPRRGRICPRRGRSAAVAVVGGGSRRRRAVVAWWRTGRRDNLRSREPPQRAVLPPREPRLAANTTKKVYAEEGSAKSKQFNVLSASMHCLQ